MQLMHKGNPDEILDSDSEEMENSLKKSSEALPHDFSKL